jgi:hypothetical protein
MDFGRQKADRRVGEDSRGNFVTETQAALGSVDTYLSCGRLTAGAGRSITSLRER